MTGKRHYIIKTNTGYIGKLKYASSFSNGMLESYEKSCTRKNAHIFTRDEIIQPTFPEIGMLIQRELTLSCTPYSIEGLKL